MPHKSPERARQYRLSRSKERRASEKRYKDNHKEAVKARAKIYATKNAIRLKMNRDANREARRAAAKRYHQRNKEKIAAQGKVYREANADVLRAKRKAKWSTPEAKAKRKELDEAFFLKHPEKRRQYHLRAKFRMIPSEYAKLITEQNGLCAICREPERAKQNGVVRNLAIDHDHDTGKLRGLLCSDCNRSIGMMMDNPERLESAARYLRRYKPREPLALVAAIRLL